MAGRILRVVAVNLGLLLAVLVAAELIFGTWFSDDPLDRLNLSRDTQRSLSAADLYPGGGTVLYRRNHWGFRGPDLDPSSITILTVGGSTTNQIYLPEELTWQGVLERTFREAGRTSVIVANAGIDGQSTVGHLFNFDSWFANVPGLHPSFVLLYVGINDAMLGGNSTDTLSYSSWQKRFRADSAVFRLGRTIQGSIAARTGRLVHERIDWSRAQWTDRPNLTAGSPGLPAFDAAGYRDRLRGLAARVHALGAIPVLITQVRGDARTIGGRTVGLASANGLNGLDHFRRLEAVNTVTREVCRDEGLLCLDMARDLTFGDGDFYDLVHNTPQGAEKIGKWLYARLAGLV